MGPERDPLNPTPRGPGSWLRTNRTALVVVSVMLVAAALLVSRSLRRPTVQAFPPSPVAPRDSPADTLVGPDTITVDASDGGRWRYFRFALGSVVEGPEADGPDGWDLAFRRFHVIVNGGPGFAGRGGALDLGELPFDSVRTAPPDGYLENRVARDTVNPALERWYDYGWTSHILRPKPATFVIRTADGRYAKLEILSYYCPGARPGCITFRYVFQGGGGRELGYGR